ncbi:MAG: hypothetical protein GYB67_13120 [Chloroflexi bacterium]|nr:hypothetical protein [Chloroflexota bacterium]
MMKNLRTLILLAVVVALLSALGGVAAQDEPTQFAGGWPYQVPPDGHFNTYASGRLNMGIYQDLMEPPLAVFIWADGAYDPMIAESFGFTDDGNYTVTLKSGVTWSDGTPVTGQDLLTTFNTGYMIGWQIWNDLESVELVDDMTAQFNLSSQSPLIERRILTENLRPTSTYGDFAAQAGELIAAGAASGDEDFEALLAELTEFRPETFVAAGPYQLLSENITDARATLVKNEGGLNSDVVRFDEIVLWNGETETVTPLVSNGELWYGTYGFPPATEAAFVDQGIDIVRGPLYTGPGLYVNHTVYPLNQVEVRQALAYAINREENGFVSLGESGVASECMCGLSDNLLPVWVEDDVIDELNFYDYDPDLAASMLEDLGFTRGDDGVWIDDQGTRMSFELIFPAEFADWAAAAENATAQLNEFGFEITATGVQFQQQQQDVYDSNFEMAIRNWGVGSPFPRDAYLQPYNRYNGQGEVAGEGVGGGMRFDTDVTFSGGEINVFDAAVESGQGTDLAAQQALVTDLVVSFNEVLPAIPLWERYGNNPLNRNFVDGPAGDDPIFLNGGVDHFMTYLILTGGIGPA